MEIRNNFSEGSSEPKKDTQVIRVRGAAAPRVLFLTQITVFNKATEVSAGAMVLIFTRTILIL